MGAEYRRLDRILGYDLFSNVLVIMDENEHPLTLIEPANFQYSGSGSVLPLTFGGRGNGFRRTLCDTSVLSGHGLL